MLGKTISITNIEVGDCVIAEIPTLIRTKTMYPHEEDNNIDDFGTYTYVKCYIDDFDPSPLEWYVWIPDDYVNYGVYDDWLTVKAKRCGCKGYDKDKLYIDNYKYGHIEKYPIRFCEWDDRMKYVNEFVRRCLQSHIKQVNEKVIEYLERINDVNEMDYYEVILDTGVIDDSETLSLMPFYGFKPWVDISNRSDILEYDKRTATKHIKERERWLLRADEITGNC